MSQENYSEYIENVGKGETIKCKEVYCNECTAVQNRGENIMVSNWELVK